LRAHYYGLIATHGVSCE